MSDFYPCPHTMADNLLNVFNAVQCADPDTFNDGLNWYNDAHSFCALTAVEHGLSLSSVVAIVAALSPAVAWEKNKEDAVSLIVDPENAVVSTYGKNREKAVQIVLGADPDEILGGDKVISFYKFTDKRIIRFRTIGDNRIFPGKQQKIKTILAPTHDHIYKTGVKLFYLGNVQFDCIHQHPAIIIRIGNFPGKSM